MSNWETLFQEFDARHPPEVKNKLSSGILSFDLAVGGGIAKQEITEIYDLESSMGKTSLALNFAQSVTQKGGIVVYFSLEQTLTKQLLKNRGIDLNLLYYCSEAKDDTLLDICQEISPGPDLIVIDSLAAVMPTNETLESEYRYSLLRRILRELNSVAVDNNIAILLLNQSRSKFHTTTTVGGLGVEQWANLRVSLKSIDFIHDNFIKVGRKIQVNISRRESSKTEKVYLDLIFNQGFDQYTDLLDLGLTKGSIHREGAWFRFHELTLGKGRKKSAEFLRFNTQVFEQLWKDVEEICLA